MHCKYKRYDDSEYYYDLFKDLRCSKKSNKKDDFRYKKNVQSNIINKPTGFYNYIKSLNDKYAIPIIISPEKNRMLQYTLVNVL